MKDLLLHAVINNVDEWKSIIDATSSMTETIMFICNTDGITLRGMDESHVALFNITIPDSSFKKFNAKTSFFALLLDDFKRVFDNALTTDTVELLAFDHNILKILINGQLQSEFNLSLLDRKKTNIPIPKLDYTSKISIRPSIMNRIFTNIESIAEEIRINCDSEKLKFLGKSDSGDAKIELSKNSPDIIVMKFTKSASSIYSLNYLTRVIRSLGKTSKDMSFEFANKNPIHLNFQMNSSMIVDYYVSPKAE